LQANLHNLMRLCATNGITMTIQESPITSTLQVDGVIYSEGFNRDTFVQTLDSVNVCIEKIHTLIPGSRQALQAPSGYSYGQLAETTGRSH
jgi:hypothetical protein